MKIRFQADNDVDQRIIDAVMRLLPDCDFKTAPEVGFHTGTPDPEVLRIAAKDNRVLISHDLKTLPQHFGIFLSHIFLSSRHIKQTEKCVTEKSTAE